MQLLLNPWRGTGLPASYATSGSDASACAAVSTDVEAVQALLAQCPLAKETPLLADRPLAQRFAVAEVWLKDERQRMNLGSFKALGAAYVIARQAAAITPQPNAATLAGETYCCASAGNHGLSVAAGARIFGAAAVIYLAAGVPAGFARRLIAKGARVVRAGNHYEQSLEAAKAAAQANRWVLLADTTWHGYSELPRAVMEGYLVIGAEVAAQIAAPPTHLFVQAGVGGLAAAATAMARRYWGTQTTVIVVEPSYAPALHHSIRAGHALVAGGPSSIMGRLDCKQPSLLALAYLAREADAFQLIDDQEVSALVAQLATTELATSASGAAGLCALATLDAPARAQLGVTAQSRVLVYLSEGATD